MLHTFGVLFPLPTALRPLGIGSLPPFTHSSADLCAVIFFCPSLLHFQAHRQARLSHYTSVYQGIAREAWIRLIRGFLKTCAQPADLPDTEFHLFINSVTKFFLLHSSLWLRELHGRHQLVVPEHWHFGLIKEAHDDLGHKGVFTVWTWLLLRFWWPMLVEDIKWFV